MTTAPHPVAVPARAARPGTVLAVCSLSVFLGGLDSTIVTIGLPEIGRSLHAGVSGLQWAADAYTVTLASLLMFSGAAADRIGRRAVLQAGLSVFVLGSWLCSVAPSLGVLIAFRVLQGAGASAMNPAALGIVTNVYPDPARRARALGVWDAAYGLSMVTGPVAGGVLVSLAGWRSVFWASIPAGLAALALTGLLVPDSRAPAPRRADPAGQALVCVMLAALAAAIIQAPGWGWRSWRTEALLAAAVGALAGLAYIEPRRSDPLIQLGLFRSARFAASITSGVCGIAALAGFGFLSSLYLQDVRGMSALDAGLTIGPMAAEMAVCAPLAGRMIARRGARIPTISAGIALAASSAALSRADRPVVGGVPQRDLQPVWSRGGSAQPGRDLRRDVLSPRRPGRGGERDEFFQPAARAVPGHCGHRHRARRLPAWVYAVRLSARRPRKLADHGRLRAARPRGGHGGQLAPHRPTARTSRPPARLTAWPRALTGPGGLCGCETTRGKAGVEFLAKHVQGPASERRNLSPRIGPV